jgi:hypothetical protein
VNPLENEELLIKINDESDLVTCIDRTTLKFRDNRLSYQREINPELMDPELHNSIEESFLIPMLTDDITWTERLFYDIGNRKM